MGAVLHDRPMWLHDRREPGVRHPGGELSGIVDDHGWRDCETGPLGHSEEGALVRREAIGGEVREREPYVRREVVAVFQKRLDRWVRDRQHDGCPNEGGDLPDFHGVTLRLPKGVHREAMCPHAAAGAREREPLRGRHMDLVSRTDQGARRRERRALVAIGDED
jgi:hypothetical protein